MDDLLVRLLGFPNVLITSHQGFLTDEALTQIAIVTLQNITDFEEHKPLENKFRFLRILQKICNKKNCLAESCSSDKFFTISLERRLYWKLDRD